MRQFIVLGFRSESNREDGEMMYLGSDRQKAMKVVQEDVNEFSRQSLFEVAIPQKTCRFSGGAPTEPSEPESEEETVVEEDPDQAQLDAPEMSDSARELAEEHGLTVEQLLAITPTGKSGDILKSDVELFIETELPEL